MCDRCPAPNIYFNTAEPGNIINRSTHLVQTRRGYGQANAQDYHEGEVFKHPDVKPVFVEVLWWDEPTSFESPFN